MDVDVNECKLNSNHKYTNNDNDIGIRKYYITALKPPGSADKPGQFNKKKEEKLLAKGIVLIEKGHQPANNSRLSKTRAQIEQNSTLQRGLPILISQLFSKNESVHQHCGITKYDNNKTESPAAYRDDNDQKCGKMTS